MKEPALSHFLNRKDKKKPTAPVDNGDIGTYITITVYYHAISLS
jgi:hypothetical protein